MNTFQRYFVTYIFALVMGGLAPAQFRSLPVGAAVNGPPDTLIQQSDRTVLADDIAHYRFDVRVGPGPYDVIRLNRIVKERNPYRPVHTVNGVLLLPGSPNYFEAIFMTPLVSQALPWDHSLVIYLAKNDIDVWGHGLCLGPDSCRRYRLHVHEGLGNANGCPARSDRPSDRALLARYHRPEPKAHGRTRVQLWGIYGVLSSWR